jgi:hypothetical protein
VLLSTDDYAIGVPHGCAADAIPVDGVCVRVGPSCDERAMLPDEKRICLAAVADECATGELALPGRAACEALSEECVSDPAELVEGADTMVVQPDGCTERGSPFCSVAAAVRAAGDGALVVVAAGTYSESVVLERPVRIRGVCPTTVVLEGKNGPALTIRQDADQSEVRGVTLTGPHAGVLVHGADQVSLRELWVHDTARDALIFEPSTVGATPRALVERCLIHDARGGGITATDYQLQVNECHVRDIVDDSGRAAFGRGIWIRAAQGGGALTLTSSHIERATDAGVLLEGASGEVTASVVRRMVHSPARLALGGSARAIGIAAEPARAVDLSAEGPVVIASTVVEETLDAGIAVRGVEARIEESVVRLSHSPETSCAGHGVRAVGTALEPTSVTLAASLVEGSEEAGVHAIGSTVTMLDSIVRINAAGSCASAERGFGDGVAAYSQPLEGSPARVSAERTRVEASARVGVLAFGDTTISLVSSLVQGSGETPLMRAVYADNEGPAPGAPRFDLADLGQCARSDGRPFDCPAGGGTRAHVVPAFLPRLTTGQTAPRLAFKGPLTSVGFDIAQGSVGVWGREHLVDGRVENGVFELWHVPDDPTVRLWAAAPDQAGVVAPFDPQATEPPWIATVPLALLRTSNEDIWISLMHGAALAMALDPQGKSPGAVQFDTEPEATLVYLSGNTVSSQPTPAAMALVPSVPVGALQILAEPLLGDSCTLRGPLEVLPSLLTLAPFRCLP